MTEKAASFVRRIRSSLDEFSSTERRLADFLLEFPGELASYTGNELADLAGVSPATVSRFVRRIGYKGYDAARRSVRHEKQAGSPLFQPASRSAKGGHVRQHTQQVQNNLAATFARLDDDILQQVVKAICQAPQVVIFGSRASHAFAAYLRWQIIQVTPHVVTIPGAGETLAEYLVGLGARDCVIVFGMRRQTAQMAQVLRAASKVGARIVFISDQASPDYAGATWSFQCECRGAGQLDDHTSVMALCGLIGTMVIESTGSAGRRRLAAVETTHDELEEL